jgi:hypothetical protein
VTETEPQAGRSRSRRPSKVRVGGNTWNISYLTHAEWTSHPRCSDDEAGNSLGSVHTILVRLSNDTTRYDDHSIRDTVLHEIMHAVWLETGLTFHHEYVKRKNLEEYVVSSTATCLVAVLQDNPGLVKWISERS